MLLAFDLLVIIQKASQYQIESVRIATFEHF